MELKWIRVEDDLPLECEPVLAKVHLDDLTVIVILTMVMGRWVTDASVSAVYGEEAHRVVDPEYLPIEWARIEEEVHSELTEVESTTSGNKERKLHLERSRLISCGRCGYHKGENRSKRQRSDRYKTNRIGRR